MQVMLVLSQSQAMVQELAVSGGATELIFPEAELLLAEIEFQQSLEYIGWQKRMKQYRSMVDFLFCELFPAFRPACFRFYAEKGPQLRFTITPAQRVAFAKVMCVALVVARGVHEQRVRTTWMDFRETVYAASGLSAA